MAMLFLLTAILTAIGGYGARNSPVKSDPRVLRKIAKLGGVTGVGALSVLLLRVHGQWILLGESMNLVLALVAIFGLTWALFSLLLIREQ
jgi:hypothetical protein